MKRQRLHRSAREWSLSAVVPSRETTIEEAALAAEVRRDEVFLSADLSERAESPGAESTALIAFVAGPFSSSSWLTWRAWRLPLWLRLWVRSLLWLQSLSWSLRPFKPLVA